MDITTLHYLNEPVNEKVEVAREQAARLNALIFLAQVVDQVADLLETRHSQSRSRSREHNAGQPVDQAINRRRE